MVDESKPEPRYKWTPIVATAKKVGEVKGETVLKINVPIEEDAKTMVEAAKRINRDEREQEAKDRDKKERDEREKRELMVTEENVRLKREKEELEKRMAEEREREKRERDERERDKKERDERDRDKKERDERDRDKKERDERERDKKERDEGKKKAEAKSYSNKIPSGTTEIVMSTSGDAGFGIVDDVVKDLKANKNKKKGDRKMEDYEIEQKVKSLVDKGVRETLGQMDIQKTIKDIGMSSAQTEKKVMAIEESLDGISETLKGLIAYEKEVEGGIGSAKNDIDKYGKESAEKMDHVHQKIESLEKKIPEKVLCSGEKGCNAEIEVGSSFCPNCSRPIDQWPDMPDWVPYSGRKK